MTGRGVASALLIVAAATVSLVCSLALDLVVLRGATSFDAPPLALLMNAISLLQTGVGAVIEWRRPGHAIGRLLMLSGSIFAFLALGWTAGSVLEETVDPAVYAALDWSVAMLSYPGLAIVAGWLPLLFPTGSLPGPRWRIPVAILLVTSGTALLALATRPGPIVEGGGDNPIGVADWPPSLQLLVDSLLLQLAVLAIMAVIGLAVRYRRGDAIERHQIRWLLGAVTVVAFGFLATLVESALRTDGGIMVSIVIVFGGLLLMPIAIGFAVLRYRLFEIDRIISRTLGWTIVTGLLVAVFFGLVVGLQALLVDVTQGQTLAVAASTLVAFALFQPVRRRVQHAVDRLFDRARYDAELTAAAFAERLRDEVDIRAVTGDLAHTARAALAPDILSIWLRRP